MTNPWIKTLSRRQNPINSIIIHPDTKYSFKGEKMTSKSGNTATVSDTNDVFSIFCIFKILRIRFDLVYFFKTKTIELLTCSMRVLVVPLKKLFSQQFYMTPTLKVETSFLIFTFLEMILYCNQWNNWSVYKIELSFYAVPDYP